MDKGDIDSERSAAVQNIAVPPTSADGPTKFQINNSPMRTNRVRK